MDGKVLGSEQAVAFVPTTDLDRARTFYGAVLGLTVEQTNPYACVLRAGSTRLRVTKVAELRPQPFTVLGWEVLDIVQTMRNLVERGIVFERYDGLKVDEQGLWTTPAGDQVAWFKDPDGNTLSVTQHVGDTAR